jgi:hypothetical protein
MPIFYSAVDRAGFRAALRGEPMIYGDEPHDMAFGDCLMQVETYACEVTERDCALDIG